MRRNNRLYLPTLVLVALAATGTVVGCSVDSGGPSLNPQPLPPNHPPDDEKEEGAAGSLDGNEDGKESSSSSGGGEPPPLQPKGDAGDGSQ